LADEVPCDKCVVELFCRVKSGEELRLDDDLYKISRVKVQNVVHLRGPRGTVLQYKGRRTAVVCQ
jgi:hypothetical protein